MAEIILKRTYAEIGTVGNDQMMYDETVYYFETDTRTAGQHSETITVPTGSVAETSHRTDAPFWWECIDTTKRKYYHDGYGGFTTQDEPNAADCSVPPAHPADGTFIRNSCNGVNLQQVLADGQGGERWGNVVEYNSVSCGYVTPVYGCTDPQAENYNPNATHDDTSCTYAPKVFTEVKTIVVRPCMPGVYLRWLNSLGGVEGWLFTGKVSHPFASEASGEYTLPSGLKGAAQKHGSTHMVLRTSGLNFNQYQALCELYTSPLVWLHQEDREPEQVYVVPGNVDPEPGRKSYELAVELSLTPPNM